MKKKVYILEDRGIIYINGLDAKEFLQNIITNDINKVMRNQSCFAYLLTPQGKYFFDFIIIKHKNGYLLIVKILKLKIFKQLNLYINYVQKLKFLI